MKYIKLLIVGVCVILIANGCRGGKAQPGGGFIPRITDVQTLNIADTSGRFTSDDQLSFTITADDEDLDMKTLFVTEYLNSETPYYGPIEIPLPNQISNVMTYSNIGPITISGPSGDYRLDFQIEDARGNISNSLSITIPLQ
jgi:hypothetical protein